MKKQLSLVIFKDDDWWVAQCLEYDIAVQARTIPDVQYEIQRVLVGRIAMSAKLNVAPFEGISPAPELTPNVLRSLCAQLDIPHEGFGLELG